LNEVLLRSDSVTEVLSRWSGGRIAARVLPVPEKPPGPERRQRLCLGPGEVIAYRRVELIGGGLVLAEADNWYVPARLPPGAETLLRTTDTPFGLAVRALAPRREVLSVRLRPGESPVLEHQAVLRTADGMPFCEVHEYFLPALLRDAGG
jgi:chorismate-pyruvate lyase